MTHFPEELIEAARAMYDARWGKDKFRYLQHPDQDKWCQAFAAGLRALANAYPGDPIDTVPAYMRGIAAGIS